MARLAQAISFEELHGDPVQVWRVGPYDTGMVEEADVCDRAFGHDSLVSGQQGVVEAVASSKARVVALARRKVLEVSVGSLVAHGLQPLRRAYISRRLDGDHDRRVLNGFEAVDAHRCVVEVAERVSNERYDAFAVEIVVEDSVFAASSLSR